MRSLRPGETWEDALKEAKRKVLAGEVVVRTTDDVIREYAEGLERKVAALEAETADRALWMRNRQEISDQCEEMRADLLALRKERDEARAHCALLAESNAAALSVINQWEDLFDGEVSNLELHQQDQLRAAEAAFGTARKKAREGGAL